MTRQRAWPLVAHCRSRSHLLTVSFQAILMPLWTRKGICNLVVCDIRSLANFCISLTWFQSPHLESSLRCWMYNLRCQRCTQDKVCKVWYYLELDRCVHNISVPVYAEAAEHNMKQEGFKDKFQRLPWNSLMCGWGNWCQWTIEDLVWFFIRLMRFDDILTFSWCTTVLMYLHWSFFAQVPIDHPIEPQHSQYALSLAAAFEAACSILGAIHGQFGLFPKSIEHLMLLAVVDSCFLKHCVCDMISLQSFTFKLFHTY